MDTNNDQSRPWEKSNTLPHKLSGNSGGSQSSAPNNGTTNNGSESPRPSRKRFGSASEETILKQVNGDGLSIANTHDLEALKSEILREVRIEINKATKEIIDGNIHSVMSLFGTMCAVTQNHFSPFLPNSY